MSQTKGDDGKADSQSQARQNHILGLSTDGLAGLSVDEITGNKTAITMIMHYYRILVEENTSLKNDLNTARTYVAGYAAKKVNSGIGATLLLVANVCIGFGVNLLTSQQTAAGSATLIPGLVLAAVGTYFTTKDS